MRFLGRLLKAIFTAGEKDSFLPETAHERLRVKIHYWQHQACLYEVAGQPRLARRCREIAQQYRAKLVALVFRNEAA
jgi:hypothetical protein